MVATVGRWLDAKPRPGGLWKGRQPYVFDGTTGTTPDTPENQAADPQVYNQGPGIGFPIARPAVGVLTGLRGGCEPGGGRYAGKGQGEVSLLRPLWGVLAPATAPGGRADVPLCRHARVVGAGPQEAVPEPRPDGFYATNATAWTHVGSPDDYYAWEWGDAVPVALDPVSTTGRTRGKNKTPEGTGRGRSGRSSTTGR